MRVIVCGSRDIVNLNLDVIGMAVLGVISDQHDIKHGITVLSGGCRGVDTIGEAWAERHGHAVERFPADWSQGKKAGPLRNAAMVAEADALVAIAYPDSRGTADCIRRAQAKGIPCAVLYLPRRAT